MRHNQVKAKLKRGEAVLGAWLSLPSLPLARVMARQGFDWLAIDGEHSAQQPALLADMIGAIVDVGTCAPIVRLPGLGVEWVKWALDAGAWGVIVPMVNSAQEARQAVAYAKYPPLGVRSVGGVFAPYGLGTTSWPDYVRAANDEILVAVQIESVQALENLGAILTVPGIDVAFVGPNDLRTQLGLVPGTQGTETVFVEALQRIEAEARKHQVAPGIFCSDGENAARRIRQGFQMVNVTTDITSLITAATHNLRLAQQ
jgi:4-hydroxy-2-oxoheptanedioate aldolase